MTLRTWKPQGTGWYGNRTRYLFEPSCVLDAFQNNPWNTVMMLPCVT